jgi:FdhE protein
MTMTRDAWLARHPYLQPVADVHRLVEAAVVEIPLAPAAIPDWTRYDDDFRAGVPLLHSDSAGVDLAAADVAVETLVKTLAASSSPLLETVAEQCRQSHPGLIRYLAWTVVARYVGPLVGAFDAWRNEDHWMRNYCPTCGEPPAMAQLVGQDPGRLRKLSCGRCTTRWRYRRTGCPFCDDQDEHRLDVLSVEGDAGLRIDYCAVCRGYLKTYDGEGNEGVMLADWTSLHLDLIAGDRGLTRKAASLYDLDTSLTQSR